MMKFCQEQACEQKGSTGAPGIYPTALQHRKYIFWLLRTKSEPQRMYLFINKSLSCKLKPWSGFGRCNSWSLSSEALIPSKRLAMRHAFILFGILSLPEHRAISQIINHGELVGLRCTWLLKSLLSCSFVPFIKSAQNTIFLWKVPVVALLKKDVNNQKAGRRSRIDFKKKSLNLMLE